MMGESLTAALCNGECDFISQRNDKAHEQAIVWFMSQLSAMWDGSGCSCLLSISPATNPYTPVKKKRKMFGLQKEILNVMDLRE